MATSMNQSTAQRLWEVDTLRGLAVVGMVIYHIAFDLHFLGAYGGDMYHGPWRLLAYSVGSTFIFLLGVSMTLRLHRLPPEQRHRQAFSPYLRRGLELLGWGMVITGVTYFAVGRRFVVFGILHLLGLSTILAFPFLRSRWASLVAGVVVIVLGVYASELVFAGPWLLWLGGSQVGRAMVDHYPILPWLGPALMGIFAGRTLYPRGSRRYRLPDLSGWGPVRALRLLGRHSLPIYLIHQPVLLGFMMLIGIGSL
jgi:uncharacterized membrane protein